MFDQAKNLMIGLFVIAAVTIVVFILLFIHPMVGDEGKTLRVRFSNIDKINVGTSVTFGGMPVGEVVSIQEAIRESDPRAAVDGQVYAYELVLAVDSSVNVYNSDKISLRTSGLLGEKSVNITPLPPRANVPLRLVNDEIIFAEEAGAVEDTFKEIKNLSNKVDLALDDLRDALRDLKKNKVMEKIADTFENLQEITHALNKPNDWSDLLENITTLSTDLVNSWSTIDDAIVNIADTAANAKEITNKGKIIVADVKEGKGTVGKLLMTDDLYLKISSLFSKGEIILNDVNHYGILFHLDKNWQRLRARRLNLMQKLCSPQQFRNYFNDEIDQINTSLSRVYMVLNKTGRCSIAPNLVKDCEFIKVYSELMRRVEDVEEQLKMYNTQLQDYNVHQTELGTGCRY